MAKNRRANHYWSGGPATPKPNHMIAQIEAHYAAKYNTMLDIIVQMGQDAAMIAANDVFHLGPTRAAAFAAAYTEAVNDMARLIDEDSNDDRSLIYAKAKIDSRLRQIVGETNFAPWEVRYGKR